MSDGRRYSDAEVRKIIEKALSLQKKESNGDTASEGQGVTLSEIDAIAREAGISSSLIRRAASELETQGVSEKQNRFLGGTVNPVEVQLAEGIASQHDLERVFAMIPSITGENGTGSVVGSSLSWATNAEVVQRTGHSVDISVTPSGEKSLVRVRNRLGQLAAGLFGGLMGGVGLGAGLGVGLGVGLKTLESLPFAVLFPIATLTGSYLLARLIFYLFSISRKSRIKDMSESIVRLIESTVERPETR